MGLAQNEDRKNLFWKILIAASSVLLVAIAAYFIYQLFTGNPLEGTWEYEDGNLLMTIKDGETMELELSEYFDGGTAALTMSYEVDVDSKTLTLHMGEEAISEAAEKSEGKISVSEIKNVADALEGAYDYNIEQNRLTLTEREYGEQMIFDKR